MFLHEPGEENDSFTRQDLSSMNSISTQQPAQAHASHSTAHPLQPQPPPQRGPAVAAAAPMHRQDSNDAHSPTHGAGDAPALPATANWGSKATQRRASRSTNASTSSPMIANATPAAQSSEPARTEPEPPKKKGKDKEKSAQTSKSTTPQPQPMPSAHPPKPSLPDFDSIIKAISSPEFKFVFNTKAVSQADLESIMNFPKLLDPNGGAKRRAMKENEKELDNEREAEAQAASAPASAAPEGEENTEAAGGGSLQLGGEPEERHEVGGGHGTQHAIAPPAQHSLFGLTTPLEEFGNLNGRPLTTQQQQLLFKSGGQQSAGLLSTFQGNQAHQAQSQTSAAPGHTRHASRFSFANDSASAVASVQPVANQKLMSQQSSMMPKNSSHFNQISQHQALGSQFYTSGVQGPPPGLKATGTPPVSGGGMFSQGHSFATGGLGYGANAVGRNTNEAYQELMRRGMDGGARIADTGKRESMFPSFLNQNPTTSTPAPTPGLISYPYGPSPGAYQESGAQKSKKKGKKHRHANTSSSGGGLVDASDPSILQARLHQSGNMVGQGLYGAQGQGGFPSIYNTNYGGGAGRW